MEEEINQSGEPTGDNLGGLLTISERNIDEAPMEDRTRQPEEPTSGSPRALTVPGGHDDEGSASDEANEGMPGFLGVGGLPRAHFIEGTSQEDSVFMTPTKVPDTMSLNPRCVSL